MPPEPKSNVTGLILAKLVFGPTRKLGTRARAATYRRVALGEGKGNGPEEAGLLPLWYVAWATAICFVRPQTALIGRSVMVLALMEVLPFFFAYSCCV